MTIHHAKVKKAATQGFMLSYDADAESVTALHVATNTRVTISCEDYETDNEAADEAWAITGDMAAFKEENEGYTCFQEDGFYISDGADATFHGDTWEDAKEAFADRDAGEEVEADEEDERPASVVPAEYKRRYAEQSESGQDCGDWLAGALAGASAGSLDRLEEIGWANGVEYPNPGVGNNGWQGRYRMTMRNKLRTRVAANGGLMVPGGEKVEAPEAWAKANLPKPKKLGKKAKAALEAEEAKLKEGGE